MTENTTRPGLWPIPGDGVLARQGDLVLLARTADDEFIDRLLALLERTADSGGDGRRLADAVADLLASQPGWPASGDEPGPAVVAFGPAGPGLALSISGAANAEISTAAGTQRLVPGPPGVQLRCLLSAPATTVRSELSTSDTVTGQPDRFSRLDQGTTRAGGLVYVPSIASGGPEPQAGPAPAATEPDAEPPTAATGPEPEPPTTASQPEPEPPTTPSEPEPAPVRIATEVTAAPAVSESRAAPADTEAVAAPAAREPRPPAEAGLPAEPSPDEVERRPPPPGDQEPDLGVLAFDDGSIFQLDGDYVIGREPTLNELVASGQARPLPVMDDAGIVSRAHAAVRLDGWRVLVTDLGSANGTRVRRASEASQPLTPHVAVELVPGSHVDLGGGYGFRYEPRRSH